MEGGAQEASRCDRCGGVALEETSETLKVELPRCGFSCADEVPASRCPGCGAVRLDGAAVERFQLKVCCRLADGAVHDGEALRYMRKALRLRACDLARLLGVTPETISHWETGKARPACAAFVVTAAMVQDRLDGRTTTRDRLAKIAARAATVTRRE